MNTETQRKSRVSLLGLIAVLVVMMLALLALPSRAAAEESDTTSERGGPPFCATSENGPPLEVGPPDGKGPSDVAVHSRPNPGTPFVALRATAELTGTKLRDVTSELRDGATFASYAAEFGVTEAELTDAILANMKALRAEMIAQFGVEGLDAPDPADVTEHRVAELIHETGFGPVGPCHAARSE